MGQHRPNSSRVCSATECDANLRNIPAPYKLRPGDQFEHRRYNQIKVRKSHVALIRSESVRGFEPKTQGRNRTNTLAVNRHLGNC